MAKLVLPSGHGHGWKPDTPDHRDQPMSHLLSTGKKVRKTVTDIAELNAKFIPPVRDQGYLGSCTGFGVSGALMYKLRQHNRTTSLSAMFAYYNGRVIEGSVEEDAGCEIRDVVKAGAKLGVALEGDYKYKPKNFARAPSATAYERAQPHQVVGYFRCYTVDDIVQALANDMPVVGGFACFSNLSESDQSGDIYMPMGRDRLEGGHCVWFTKVSLNARRLTFQNSWGEWGAKGYGTLPFEFVERRLAMDFWAIDHE